MWLSCAGFELPWAQTICGAPCCATFTHHVLRASTFRVAVAPSISCCIMLGSVSTPQHLCTFRVSGMLRLAPVSSLTACAHGQGLCWHTVGWHSWAGPPAAEPTRAPPRALFAPCPCQYSGVSDGDVLPTWWVWLVLSGWNGCFSDNEWDGSPFRVYWACGSSCQGALFVCFSLGFALCFWVCRLPSSALERKASSGGFTQPDPGRAGFSLGGRLGSSSQPGQPGVDPSFPSGLALFCLVTSITR